jgi:polyferredoxin
VKARIPSGSREERLNFAYEWLRRRDALPRVRFSRRRRRVLVGAGALVLALLFIALPGASFQSTLPEPAVVGLVLLLVVLAWLMLLINGSVGNFAAQRGRLDERERAQRDRATAVSYRLVQAGIVIVTGYAMLGSSGKVGLPVPTNAGQLMMFLLPLYFLALTLPTAVLAWTLPDPDPEPVVDAEPAPV